MMIIIPSGAWARLREKPRNALALLG